MSTNTFETITFETLNSKFGVLTINREAKFNALNSQVLMELKELLSDLSDNREKLQGMIVTGAGEKAFIAGADIAEMSSMETDEAFDFAELGQEVTLLFEALPYPVIACVNGFALGGGCEMAMACDFIYATENAVFGQPEVKLGLIPGFGGTQRLAKIIGRNKAKELIYTGRNVKAAEAKEIGLVVKTFATKDELIAAATATLEEISKNSPLAVGLSKFVMNEGNDLDVPAGLAIEAKHFGDIFSSYDMKEGTKAFVEKRVAEFKGE
ncbi:enoyl-CoA hydratase/isomerase family protein [Bacteriovorax sp. Seq25_V]|uniref:enoyl-CoA hydratase/isomerase family protein n=1 Tax=Bacteriovorax sp. Seq25_V TaxID=1201288 RepID=UPI00038A10C7|nr:enoyl-CoA hydratase-related protein [Bacteriovorax sp. Seq25_V]EQC45412.1 3-hydroxybutyryl-CoA dehydratase [Bacteriovorax sp. Seq25_V]